MNILTVGALSLPYVNDNWVMPMRKLFNCDFIDVSPLLNCYDSQFVEQYIYSIVRTGDYNFLFFYCDAIRADFSQGFFDTIRSKGIKIITYYPDDEPDKWYNLNIPYDKRFDLIGTHSSRGLAKREVNGMAGNFIYLPWGYNPNIFYKIEGCQKIYDVVCFAARKDNEALYMQEGGWREQLLINTYQFCKNFEIKFTLFGGGWEHHPILHECAGGFVEQDDMVIIYNQAKLVLNPGYAADVEGLNFQTKLRHFEVPGCGTLQLTNENPELAKLFKVDESIVFFRDEKDLKEKILYYIEHESGREIIAQAAYQQALCNHTMHHRLRTLFGEAMQRFKPPPKSSVKRINIKQIPYNGMDDALTCARQIMNSASTEECYYHFIGLPNLFRFEYSALHLPSFDKDKIIGIRSYYQLASIYNDPIQRKRQNMLGIMLPELIAKYYLHNHVLRQLRNHSWNLEDEKYIAIIDNFLIPVTLLANVAHAFEHNQYAEFLKLPIFNSGILVNDFIFPGNIYEQLGEVWKYPPYVIKLARVLNNIADSEQTVLVYGCKGAMADNVFTMLKKFPSIKVIGIIDKSITAKYYKGYKVFQRDDISILCPDFTIIAAEFSGKEIYKDINVFSCDTTFIPLYDLHHVLWNLFE